MGDEPATKESHTDAIVELLFGLTERVRVHSEIIAGEFDLPLAQAAALLHLRDPIPMSELATALTCDRSNITGIIDRLEERGLVERLTDAADRRVKQLVLTRAGHRMRDRLHTRLYGDLLHTPGVTADLASLGELLATADGAAPQ
ncbi:MAG: MarR family winged helix-turn-helix transcriptional regulator [Acidimicrobiia bacterium]